MRIVLATRDTDLRLSLELLLSEEPGVKILGGASDSEGFFALVESTCPDLVLLDWNLPGRPVKEVLDQTKLLKVQPKIIVLGKNPDLKNEALQAGAGAYVDKGEPPERLLAAFKLLNSK